MNNSLYSRSMTIIIWWPVAYVIFYVLVLNTELLNVCKVAYYDVYLWLCVCCSFKCDTDATRSKFLSTRSSAIAEGSRDASCQLKSCQLPRNSAETILVQVLKKIEVMKLEGYSGPMCNKPVHSTMTRSIRFHCLIGVINKPTMDEFWISPVYRRATTCCGEIF